MGKTRLRFNKREISLIQQNYSCAINKEEHIRVAYIGSAYPLVIADFKYLLNDLRLGDRKIMLGIWKFLSPFEKKVVERLFIKIWNGANQ